MNKADTIDLTQNIDESIIGNLKLFIERMKDINDYHIILNTIIETHLKLDNRDILIKNLVQHLSEVFNINGYTLISYLQFPKVFNLTDLNLGAQYKQSVECINKIKLKYGFIIRDLLLTSQSPFLTTSIDVNVNLGNSLHWIRMIRGDGSSLNGLCNSEILMSLITGLLSSLETSMEKGIYTFSDITINNFLKQNDHFVKYLHEVIDLSKSHNEVAISAEKVKMNES